MNIHIAMGENFQLYSIKILARINSHNIVCAQYRALILGTNFTKFNACQTFHMTSMHTAPHTRRLHCT